MAGCMGILGIAFAREPATFGYRLAIARDKAAATFRVQAEARKRKAHQLATERGWRISGRTDAGEYYQIEAVEDGRPVYTITNNMNAAITTAADRVRDTFPFLVSGEGYTVGVWDGGSVRATHREFEGRVNRVEVVELNSHATHVAGTIGAAGIQANAEGMAPGVTIDSYDFEQHNSEMTSRAAAGRSEPGKIFVSNHSYGNIVGWQGGDFSGMSGPHWFGPWPQREDPELGRYNDQAAIWDAICHSAPYYLPFKAIGNDRDDNAPSEGATFFVFQGNGWRSEIYDPATGPFSDGFDQGGYDTTPTYSGAKNIMTVGAVTDAISGGQRNVNASSMTTFSCWGPTDDGRIKPDIVANGFFLTSPTAENDSAYSQFLGTSMSSPNACGSAVLLLDYYNQVFPGDQLRSSTLKALILHAADDMGRPGPDYQFGWGLMNTRTAAELIAQHADSPDRHVIKVDESLSSVNPSDAYSFEWNGTSPIRVTICWTDPAGTIQNGLDNRTPVLVNDLDLRVTGPDGTQYLPFVLAPDNPTLPAATGDNILDNVEQVLIEQPPLAGTYTVTVSHKGSLRNDFQWYSLISSGQTLESLTVIPQITGASTGFVGGPFEPDCHEYTLTNTGVDAVDWTAGPSVAWLAATPDAGTLDGGESVTFDVCFNDAARTLGEGEHNGVARFTNTASGNTIERAINVQVEGVVKVPFFDDFEGTAGLGPQWTVTGVGPSRAEVTDLHAPFAGNGHAVMDTLTDGAFARNELTIRADLAGHTGVEVSFQAKGFNDERHAPPTSPFDAGADFDGVAVSLDGSTWHEVAGLRGSLTCDYRPVTVSLDPIVAALGLSYTNDFHIRFNQYGNEITPLDGIALDNVSITGQFTGGQPSPGEPPPAPIPPIPKPFPHPMSTSQAAGADGLGTRLYGTVADGRAGSGVSGAGDFNGDGFEDFIIGVANHAVGEVAQTGAAALVFGGPGRLEDPAAALLDPDLNAGTFVLSRLDGSNGFLIQGSVVPFGHLGSEVSGAGDVNGDGFDDLLLYAAGPGEAWLVYGGDQPLGPEGTIGIDAIAAGRRARLFASDHPAGLSGSMSGAGDVNGDGTRDFLIGAASDRRVYLVHGDAQGVGVGGELDLDSLSGPGGTVIVGLAEGFGSSVSGAGDVNGDGYDDIAVGADAGEQAFLILGSPLGVGVGGQLLVGFTTPGVARFDGSGIASFGASVEGAGDVNGDGLDDFLIGAPGDSLNHGTVNLVFGSSGGLPIGGVVEACAIHGGLGITIQGLGNDDRFGFRATGAGDVDGDGYSDLLAMSPARAQTFLIYGAAGGVEGHTLFSLANLDGVNGARIDDTPLGHGQSAAGDVNGDGASDFILSHDLGQGATDNGDPGAGPAGEAYLFNGVPFAADGTYHVNTPPGDRPRRGAGLLRNGSHSTPFSRCWIDFDGGQAPGGGASRETVRLLRSRADLSGLIDPQKVAHVHWQIASDRQSWNQARVTFKYTDAETAGLAESVLKLYRAPAAAGPWTLLTDPNVDTERNRISTLTDEFGFFALVEDPLPVPSEAGAVRFGRRGYNCSDGQVTVELFDADLAGAGSHAVTLTTGENDVETLDLVEIPGRLGSFEGAIDFGSAAGTSQDGRLQVTPPLDTLEVEYLDSNNPSGLPIPRVDDVPFDCNAPAFAGLRSAAGGDWQVTLGWTVATDDNAPVTYRVYRAESAGAQDFVHPLAETSDVAYVDLEVETGVEYFYVVRALDPSGNEDGNANERRARPSGPLAEFRFDPIESPQARNGSIEVTITAVNQAGETVTNFEGPVDLSAVVDWDVAPQLRFPVPVSPQVTSPFSEGVWTGSVRVEQTADNAELIARDALLHQGISNRFDVVLPEVGFDVEAAVANEDAGLVQAPVTLSLPPGETVTVDYHVTGGSAQMGMDYSLDAGQLMFAPGDAQRLLTITLVDDPLDESTEDIQITLDSPTNAQLTSSAVYTLDILDDDTSPMVVAIERAGENPTGARMVDFRVTFDREVTGVDRGDFSPLTQGVQLAGIIDVRPADQSPDQYTVITDTGRENGSLGLEVVDDDSIRDSFGNPLGGPGVGNGGFSAGETYTVQRMGTVVIGVTPEEAAWSFTDGAGGTHQGIGNRTINEIPSGAISLTWDELPGHETPSPNPRSQPLDANGVASFIEIYVPTDDPAARTTARLLRYLLGLDDDPAGLDMNADERVNIADLVTHIQSQQDNGADPPTEERPGSE